MSLRLAVLASGRGSNFVAIQEAIQRGTLEAEIALLISDQPQAPALSHAVEFGIKAAYVPYDKSDRTAFENRAAVMIETAGCDLVVLAGFMRLITPEFIDRFENRILNIHPSLLPSFKGLHAQRQALEAGVKFAGCTVHIVTPEMDAGPILGQSVVPVLPDDDEDSLSARILEQEHQLYPQMIQEYGASL